MRDHIPFFSHEITQFKGATNGSLYFLGIWLILRFLLWVEMSSTEEEKAAASK